MGTNPSRLWNGIFLTLFVQEKLRQQYGSTEIAPFVQTPSTQVLLLTHLIKIDAVELDCVKIVATG